MTLIEAAQRVNHIHDDRVMFFKTIHGAYTIIGTSVLVEDDRGDCIMLTLYNFIQRHQKLEEVLPVGTKLALLAPYMKKMPDRRDQPLMLRCDNPQCVILYDSDAAWETAKAGKPPPVETRDAATLKKLGNDAFKAKKLDSAFSYYSKALTCVHISPDDKTACLSNRALIALRREQWEQAESDARKVLELDSSHEKAKYRLAKACSRRAKVPCE